MDYLQQLESAIVFIENNLSEEIHVEDVSKDTGYSYYHFQRVFKAVLGESIGNYIRLRRLNRAAGDLVYTDWRILDIAMNYRFDSQESFNRAFKNIYKVSPGTYRKNRIDTMIGNKREITAGYLNHIYKGVTIHPVMCLLEEKKMIGIRFQTTLKKNVLKKAWENFSSRMGEIKQTGPDAARYGICEIDDEANIEQFDENTESSYFIGTEAFSYDDIPEGMSTKVLKAGKYAVFTHKGTVDSLKMTYDYIWGTWIIYSGMALDQRDDFELYDERFLGVDNDLTEIEIYIPVK